MKAFLVRLNTFLGDSQLVLDVRSLKGNPRNPRGTSLRWISGNVGFPG